MRKVLSVVLITSLVLNLNAQRTIDSLQSLLAKAKEDTVRINLLNLIGANYREYRPDSNLKYSNEALILSRRANYREGEIRAMLNLATVFLMAGEYPSALETALEALKKSETTGNSVLLALCLNFLGRAYSAQGDYEQAQFYARKNKEIWEQTNDRSGLSRLLVSMGYAFSEMNELDSSRVYLNRSLDISLPMKNEPVIAAAYFNLGQLYLKMRQYEIASAYCRQAIPNFITKNDYSYLIYSYSLLSQIFDSTRHLDSSFFYGRLALHYANLMGFQREILDISKQLSSLFQRTGRLDSAFLYQNMAMIARDSLSSQEKQKKIQMLTFNEQLRQMDIAEQKRRNAEARKKNLEFTAIAIFIPLFFFFVLLMGRRKVKSRTVEFLGILSLLFIFEFIVLFAHPYIERLTHDSPVWMLLILVSIAAILIPLHHRTETWMKKKLTTRGTKKAQPETVAENGGQ